MEAQIIIALLSSTELYQIDYTLQGSQFISLSDKSSLENPQKNKSLDKCFLKHKSEVGT